MAKKGAEFILVPSFADSFWRREEFRRFREFSGFAKRKGHFEPDSWEESADRWARELAREDAAAEMHRVCENAVVILGNRRSGMERTEFNLSCPQFEFALEATQDREEPARVRLERRLRIHMPLCELPPVFDDLFPYPPDELVVPIAGALDRRTALLALEHWEHTLRARLQESADQRELRLRLPTGFTLKVDLERRETVFFQERASGVMRLGAALAENLPVFRITKGFEALRDSKN